ncbi:GNAT family N-acetyltransferase, partial [Streptomyces sp. NPDC056290]
MLKGTKVGLRARHEEDIPVLRAELYDDVVNASRAEGGPWRPITPGSKDPRLVVDDTEQGHVPFSVVELAGGTLVGTATLWGIDHHNRS